ncbi:ERCC4 domain-containing protein [Tricladium varicosporioides]|nr:ERCC4 domain-containing protein [Hymenoscyphus varicosporioides]
MPDIIDLVSSPELPPLDSSRMKGTITKKALNYELKKPTSRPARDNWFTISSDEVESVVSSRVPSTTTTVSHKITAPSKNSAGVLRPVQQPAQKVPTKLPHDDFFFLSDDFDSSINLTLDDPFANNTPTKKRRLSSSPQPTLPKPRDFKRAISNIESKSKSKTNYVPPLRINTTAIILESDPLLFTSSPDPFADAARKRKERRKKTFNTLEGEGDGEDTLAQDAEDKASRLNDLTFDSSSDGDLPELDALPSAKSGNSQAALAKYNAKKKARKAATKKALAKDKSTVKEVEKAEKERERERKNQAIGAEKERKRLAREEKSRAKEMATELAKVNTLKTDKKISTPEMIVELSSLLPATLVVQIREFFGPLEVECSTTESILPIIKWKRKVVSEYNEELGYWEPKPLRILPENHVMCIITAKEFVEMAMADEKDNLDAHILQLKVEFVGYEVIYLVEGLVPWMKKNRNVKNRKFTASVRGETGDPSACQRKKKKEPEYVDESMIEDALLKLQVVHGVMIHHTTAKIETAEWVVAFTQHISTIPYRKQKESLDTAFCMESGQVKTGDSHDDTFAKMLQEIMRITASVAYGIAAEYPSLQDLAKGLEKRGPLALEDLKKMANKDGAFTDRRIGPSISKRVYNVFMGKDPGSWDV